MLKWMGPQLRVGVARDVVAVLAGRGNALTVLAEQPLTPDAADLDRRAAAGRAGADKAAVVGATGMDKSAPANGASIDKLAPSTGAGMAALEQGLRTALSVAGRSGLPLQLVLADDLLRLWQVEPPQPARGLADLEAATRLRFHTLYGEELDGWELTAHWDARQPFWAAAVPLTLLAACESAAAAHGSPIVSVVPHFVARWNRHCRSLADGSWLVCVHGGLLSVGLPGPSGLHAVRTLPMPAEASLTWLQTQLEREAARAMLAPPERVALCGQLPPSWRGGSAGPLACRVLAPSPAARDGWSAASLLAAEGSAP